MVKVSIIVPVFNVENYLEECLNSLVNQSLKDIEIICVDDGSSDNSLNILKKYEKIDSRVIVISQENKGLSGARNTAMDYATGEYIYFIDSDDYIELNALEELYSLSKEKNLDVIFFKSLGVNDNKKQEIFRDHYFDMVNLSEFKNKIFNYKDLGVNVFKVNVTVYTKFFKRELIINSRFVEGYVFEDNLFFMEYIFDAKKIYFLDKYLHFRRIREDSIITSGSKSHIDVISVYNKTVEKVKQLNLYDDYKYILFNNKMDNIKIRYLEIKEEYKDYFFSEIKKDFINCKKHYEKELDFTKVDFKMKIFYRKTLKSSNRREFDDLVDNFDVIIEGENLKKQSQDLKDKSYLLQKKILKLKKENKKLKKENRSISNSTTFKITKPLRLFGNLFR